MKKFNKTKVFEAIKEHAPDVLESLGGVFPPLGVLGHALNAKSDEVKREIMDAYEQDLKDMADARKANVDIQNAQFASFLAKNTSYFIDLFLTLIWGSLTLFIIAKAFRVMGSNVNFTEVLSIYATVTAIFSQVVSFHRGSSMGSALKDARRDN